MAINIKNIIADGLLELNKNKQLSSITIKDILDYTQVSRQSFYNHFKDKNDLIQYIYTHKIVDNFNNPTSSFNFRSELLKVLDKIEINHKFMKEALLINEQNCLKNYIYDHCQDFDLIYHQNIFGNKLPIEFEFATKYHAIASTSMIISWILSNMPSGKEETVNLISQLRSHGMDKLFIESNPYK